MGLTHSLVFSLSDGISKKFPKAKVDRILIDGDPCIEITRGLNRCQVVFDQSFKIVRYSKSWNTSSTGPGVFPRELLAEFDLSEPGSSIKPILDKLAEILGEDLSEC